MEIPLVHSFLVCRRIELDAARRDFSLHRLVYRVMPLPGEPLPYICESMALFALLSNGRGTHEFGLEQVLFDHGVEEVIWQSDRRMIDLGMDPLVVHGLPIPLRNVLFPQEGQYAFCLQCDGQRLAQAELEVR